jgi:hypothetical protein
MDSIYLPEEKQAELRLRFVIQENEVACQVGDLLFAENVITRQRRLIGNSLNEGRRILKG